MAASGLAGRTLFPCLPWGESNLREVPRLAQPAASFLAETLQGALEESMPRPLPSRLWLSGPPISLTLPLNPVPRRPTGYTA